MLFFLIFLEAERAKEGVQVDPQAQEDFHESSTDSCLTFPYSSNSPRPFPPSPVHSVTESPGRISPLLIASSNPPSDNSVTHSSIVYTIPTPVPSTLPISMPSQAHSSVLLTPITNSYNTPLYIPYPSSSFPQTGPLVLPGSSSVLPYFGPSFSASAPSFPNTVSIPSYPLPPMVTPNTIPIPLSSTESQSTSGPGSFGRQVRSPRGTYSGRRRAPRSRRGKITSTASCQTSPIPSYFWPDFQPSRVPSGGSFTNNALNLTLMPRVFNHFPTSLPLDPLHFDFFTILRAASPVVTFHCPSPLTQKSFSFVYSINFPCGQTSNLFWLQESIGKYYYHYIFRQIHILTFLSFYVFLI